MFEAAKITHLVCTYACEGSTVRMCTTDGPNRACPKVKDVVFQNTIEITDA